MTEPKLMSDEIAARAIDVGLRAARAEARVEALQGELAAERAARIAAEAERDDCKADSLRLHREKMDQFEGRIAAEAEVVRLREAAHEAARFMSYFAGESLSFSGPGTPKTCLAQIRAALEPTP